VQGVLAKGKSFPELSHAATQKEIVRIFRQRYAPLLEGERKSVILEIERRFTSVVAEKQKSSTKIIKDISLLYQIYEEVKEWSEYKQMSEKKFLEELNLQMENDLNYVYREIIEPKNIEVVYDGVARKHSIDISAAFYQIFKRQLHKINPNDRYDFKRKCLLFLFVYFLIRQYLQDGEPLVLSSKVLEIHEKTNLREILEQPEMVLQNYLEKLEHLNLETYNLGPLGLSFEFTQKQVSEFLNAFALKVQKSGLLQRKGQKKRPEQVTETQKEKRKKEYTDEEMANWYLRCIHEKEDKNPTAQLLADFSQIGYGTWHRRLKKKSFNDLIMRKQDKIIENITHRQKPASKKSSHIRREIPKSHKETSFDELFGKGQVNSNNPIEEIESRIDEDRIDQLSKDECIEEILKHPNSPSDRFTKVEIEDMTLNQVRQVLKALEKRQT